MKSQELISRIINLKHTSQNDWVSFESAFVDVCAMELLSTSSDKVCLITDDMEVQLKIESEILDAIVEKLKICAIINDGRIIFYNADEVIGTLSTDTLTAKSKEISFTTLSTYIIKFKDIITSVCEKYNKPLIIRLSLSERGYLDENEVMFAVPSLNIPSEIMYPWIDKTPEKIALEFVKSNANVLLLYGEPGTGKTTFVKKMLSTIGFNKHQKITVVDSSGVMENPGMVNYIFESANNDIIVLEDVDRHLYDRKDGNEIMSGLLNASSGLASANVKMIITTNILRLSDIDSALIRPGRCFSTIQFRKLNPEEQQAFTKYLNVDYIGNIGNTELTLAEVMNPEVKSQSAQKFGFNI